MLAKGEPLLRVICFALGSASVRIRSLVISHIFSSIISRYAIIPIVIQYYIFRLFTIQNFGKGRRPGITRPETLVRGNPPCLQFRHVRIHSSQISEWTNIDLPVPGAMSTRSDEAKA